MSFIAVVSFAIVSPLTGIIVYAVSTMDSFAKLTLSIYCPGIGLYKDWFEPTDFECTHYHSVFQIL